MLQCSSPGGVLLGPGGVCLVPGGFSLVLGGFSLVRGGLPGPRGGSPWSQGGSPENPPPPVNRITDTCKNITLATTSLRPVIMPVCYSVVGLGEWGCIRYIYWQAGSWPSTERLSCSGHASIIFCTSTYTTV